MASNRCAIAADTAYDPVINNNHHLTSQPTSRSTATAAFTTQTPNTRFLPRNGPIHLAPSITHQPELLLLSWMLETLSMLARHIMDHPLSAGPTPDPTMFVDNNAYRLFYQFQLTLTDLGRATLRLIRAQRSPQHAPTDALTCLPLPETPLTPRPENAHVHETDTTTDNGLRTLPTCCRPLMTAAQLTTQETAT